ncbi:MAG TPA: serine hydrolase [Beijerinckiaceae bacterium]|jgi:CubicO group peptidase (beta-lactamase class C family)
MAIRSVAHYAPGRDADWARVAPAAGALEPSRLATAIAFAIAHETVWPRSFYLPDGRYAPLQEWNESGPWSEVVGPVRERGGPAGLVLRDGRIVAEWGDTARPDMSFSIAKSYLAVLAGIAFDDGRIKDVDEPVRVTVDSPFFAGRHNGRITWRHLLHQSSEWSGELFGKSDQVDHFRQVGPGADNSRKGRRRELQPPGSLYEYNDVRVNLLSYCLMLLFGRSLPDVLRERVMDPIGATREWEWLGYSNSWVEIGGARLQSVPGGSHWGGGLFMGARDHARFGLLMARRGVWGGRRILSEAWIEAMLAPSPTLANYGFLWWLDQAAEAKPDVSSGAFHALGAGSNVIRVDPMHDLVVVLRWIQGSALEGFFTRLRQALET